MHLHFFLHTFFFFPNTPLHSVPLPFSPSSFPFLPSFLSFFSASFHFYFLSPFFLHGNFEHFSYLSSSAITKILCFCEPWPPPNSLFLTPSLSLSEMKCTLWGLNRAFTVYICQVSAVQTSHISACLLNQMQMFSQ